MGTNYNVGELFRTAFGISSPVYIDQSIFGQPRPRVIYREPEPLPTAEQPAYTIPEDQAEAPVISFAGMEMLPDNYMDDALTSWMGTPIVFPAKFMGGIYNRYRRNGTIERVRFNDFHLPPATMFSFRRAKNIKRTDISGSNGTVKEIYGFDDWVIDVRGLCLDEPNRTAEDQLRILLQWERLADAIGIGGRLFGQREISRVAISDWSDNVQQGSPGVIAFQFQLYSDEDIILTL